MLWPVGLLSAHPLPFHRLPHSGSAPAERPGWLQIEESFGGGVAARTGQYWCTPRVYVGEEGRGRMIGRREGQGEWEGGGAVEGGTYVPL